MMKETRVRSRFTVRDTDPLVRCHRVEEIHILPGVALLDAVYKTFQAARIDGASVALRDVRFHEPVVTSAALDRKLTVLLEHAGDRGRVSITSVPWKDGQALGTKETTHMSCTWQAVGRLDAGVAARPAGTDSEGVDLDACYAVTRRIGINHDGFMKCSGRVHALAGQDFEARIALSPEAQARAGEFLLHPVFLDCSTIVPLFHLRDRLDETALFIPFAIEEFRALPCSGRAAVRVHVERPDAAIDGREVVSHSFGLYDLDGRPLVQFKKFTVKRVRSLASIRRLLQASAAVSAPVASAAPAPAPAAAPEPGGDPILALIGELIGKHTGKRFTPADAQKPFFDLGLDSLALLELAEVLEKRLAVRLYPTVLFERPDVSALVAYLREAFPEACAEYGAAPVRATPARAATPVPAGGAEPEILVPRWIPAPLGAPAARSAIALATAGGDTGLAAALATALGERVAYRADAAALVAALASGHADEWDELWLLAAGEGADDIAFAVVKALIAAGRTRRPLVVKAITRDCFGLHGGQADEAAAHGVWGLLQSLSREHPAVKVAQIDLAHADLAATALPALLAETDDRTLLAVRAGRAYRRQLYRTQPGASTPRFRRGGAYVIIGGAGGVGMELARHLRVAHDAKVALVGRRPLSDELVARLAPLGPDVLYLSAAVEDEAALAAALATAQRTFGRLDGVVHSAMVLEDRRLAEMDPASWVRVRQPKVAGARALARATAGLELDFLLVFSSVQSFVGNVAQGNYAAASTFLDGFTAAIAARRPYPVVVLNWGFWSEVGAVATESYRQLMARQGLHGLKAGAAMTALEAALAAGWEQAAVIAAEEPVLLEMGLDPSFELRRLGAPAPAPAAPVAAPLAPAEVAMFGETRAATDELLAHTRPRVRRILDELLAGRPVDAAVEAGALSPRHRELARALLDLVATAGDASEDDFRAALRALERTRPAVATLIPLLEAAVEAYPRVLSGQLPAPAALFPDGSPALVQKVYGETAVSRFYNQRLAGAVVALAGDGTRPLRILEIGAGTGATTEAVLQALAGRPCEYWYTDLWDKLVDEAKARLAPRHPELRFGFLDLNADPAAQGMGDAPGFDVVIATNVLHATRDLHGSLRHAKRLLRPGGALLLNESVETQEYSTYTFGLLPGWWTMADPGERLPASPLAAAAHWPVLLADEGFALAGTLIPPCADAPAAAAQQIYLAVSDGEIRVPAATRAAAPTALPDELRPFTPAAAPAPRHLRVYKDGGGHLWVYLDNPPANTFTDELLDELCATLQAVAAEAASGGRIVFLSHVGEYFSLGGDRAEIVRRLGAGDLEGIATFGRKAKTLIQVITSLDALVVAVVGGTAQGGGLETLLATDLQIVRAGVKLGLPEVKSGLIPGMGGLSYLKDLIGAPRTKRLVMLGDLISAEEALALGLVSHVADDPFAAARALAAEMRHLNSALYMKRVLAPEIGARLCADIDTWISYLTQHADWIDATRIANSRLLVAGRAAMKAG